MFCKNFFVQLSLISILFAGQINCFTLGQNRKVDLGEVFVLQTGETVEIRNAKLKIGLKGVGRTIGESGEVEYAELKIRLNDSEKTIEISEKGSRKRDVGDYVIKLINAESFGKTNCELEISRKN